MPTAIATVCGRCASSPVSASAKQTNERYHFLLAQGQHGLSVAFDMPTLMGYDSDARTRAARSASAASRSTRWRDMETLFDGIDMGDITTSMTINGPAAIAVAQYIAAAEKKGIPRAKLGGTIQADILKEYIAQKEWIFPPRPHMRIIVDMIQFCTAEMPKWNTISVSGYHIREAGSTAAQELAFTLADGFAYVEACMAAGMDVDSFAPRLSYFFNSHIDFFEEIAKFRAARRIYARHMREKYGAKDPKSWQLRFHTQTAGCSATAQQPENNIVRVAFEAMAAVLGGTQSLHTNSMDEVLALPEREVGRDRVAHAASSGLRNQRDQRRRSARRLVLRRSTHRRDGTPSRGVLRPDRRVRRRHRSDRVRLLPKRNRRGELPLPALDREPKTASIIGVNAFVHEDERIDDGSAEDHRGDGTRAGPQRRTTCAAAGMIPPSQRTLERLKPPVAIRKRTSCRT